MLHLFPDDNPFDHRRQLAELDYMTSSRAAYRRLLKITSDCRWTEEFGIEAKRVPITKRYQTGLVVLFFFTWGSVFLARMSVLYLAPFIAPELHLSHAQVGLLASALALAWAGSGLIFGAVSDRIGRRPVLIPAVFLFSVLSWLSGLARSFAELLFIRTLMGVAEGPTWPTMTSMIEASSEPKNRGRNIGSS